MRHALFALIGTILLALYPAAAQAQETHLTHVSVVERGRAVGPAVILIPGLSTPRVVWDQLVPEIERDHRVILVQINGFATGEAAGANADPGALDGIVEDIFGYIRDQHVERPAIIGHSMGGLTALMIAQRHPAAVDRIMIVDSLPFIGTLFVPGSTVETFRPIALGIRDRMRAMPRRAQPDLPATDPGGIMSITADGRRQVAAWASAVDPAASAEIAFEVMQTDARPGLAAMTTPVTLLYPTSPAVPAATATTLYAQAYAGTPTIRMVAIPDSYHFIMLDQPERFASAVSTFLQAE